MRPYAGSELGRKRNEKTVPKKMLENCRKMTIADGVTSNRIDLLARAHLVAIAHKIL